MRDRLNEIINDYTQSQSARAVAVDLIMMLRTAEKAAASETLDSDARGEVLRSYAALLLDLPANTFWRENAGFLTPIVAMAFNAWIDASHYMQLTLDDRQTETARTGAILQVHGLRHTAVEVALGVIYCEQGAGGLRAASVALRDKLMEAWDV